MILSYSKALSTVYRFIFSVIIGCFIFFGDLILVEKGIATGKSEAQIPENKVKSNKTKKAIWDVQVEDVKVSELNKKQGIRKIQYKLTVSGNDIITPQNPVWVFVKFSPDNGKTWMNTDDTLIANDLDHKNMNDSPVNKNLSGDIGIVESHGKKEIIWNCGEGGTGFDKDEVLVVIRPIQMCKIPSDYSFKMGGNGAQRIKDGIAQIDQFYIMKYPATYDLYAEFLTEWGNLHDPGSDDNHKYWYEDMAKEEDGGLELKGMIGQDAVWFPKNVRERWPLGYITFWNAYDFGLWTGLMLPTEPEWEKAARHVGGIDGHKYSWGNEPLPNKDICNFGNLIRHPTDVRAYEESWKRNGLKNPFGVREMTGNVWEWQDTYWYDGEKGYDPSMNLTDYNTDSLIEDRYKELDRLKADGKLSDEEWLTERKKIALKGWRVIKGGSYFDVIAALDASSRIVGDTKVRHSAVGCRFVKRGLK